MVYFLLIENTVMMHLIHPNAEFRQLREHFAFGLYYFTIQGRISVKGASRWITAYGNWPA